MERCTRRSTTRAPSSSGYDATWTNLLLQLKALRVAESSTRLYYGVMHPTYVSGGTGLAYDGEDVLADTPEFLRDAPEDDELWFEQGEPKDFDF